MTIDEHEGMHEEQKVLCEYRMEFQVVKSNNLDTLGAEVTGLMKEGWVPTGSLVVVQDLHDRPLFYQPMLGQRMVYETKGVEDASHDDIAF